MSKFIAVDIIKEVFTTVFLEVPDDMVPADVDQRAFRPTLNDAVEQLESWDWEKDPEWTTGSVRVVPEAEARQYDVFVVTGKP